MPGGAWDKIGLRKRAERAAKIPSAWRLPASAIPTSTDGRHAVTQVPRTCGILTEKELEITEKYDATALGEEIKARRLRVVDVVTAFCKRAAIAQQLTNCLTEILFSEALQRAKDLDKHLDEGKPPLSPLHGVPISLKDCFQVRGVDASIGIAALCFESSSTPSTLVEVLLRAGAVLYCKTNVPQTMGQLDSHNNVFGRTLNPHNAALTAGGSSGGEGALIALRGSVLGVGTDIGGSIRVPAMVNGIYGFKPSCRRVPYLGQQTGSLAGSTVVGLQPCAGPIAGSLRDCELFLRVVADQKPWTIDSEVIPGIFGSQPTLESTTLNIGLVTTDGLIEPLPPIQSLLKEVSAAISLANINIVEIDIRSIFSKCQSLANSLMGVTGGGKMFDLIEATKEPLSPWLQGRMKRGNPMPLDKVVYLHGRREAIESEFLKIWREEQPGKAIDVLICPVAPHPAPETDRWNGVSYTNTFNLLDYPAGVIPVRRFEPEDMKGEVPTSKPLGSWDKANRTLWTNVDRQVYVGSPLSIQVVAPKLQERKLCEAMKIIDDAIRAKYGNWQKERPAARL